MIADSLPQQARAADLVPSPRIDDVLPFVGQLTLEHLEQLARDTGVSVSGFQLPAARVDCLLDDVSAGTFGRARRARAVAFGSFLEPVKRTGSPERAAQAAAGIAKAGEPSGATTMWRGGEPASRSRSFAIAAALAAAPSARTRLVG